MTLAGLIRSEFVFSLDLSSCESYQSISLVQQSSRLTYGSVDSAIKLCNASDPLSLLIFCGLSRQYFLLLMLLFIPTSDMSICLKSGIQWRSIDVARGDPGQDSYFECCRVLQSRSRLCLLPRVRAFVPAKPKVSSVKMSNVYVVPVIGFTV